MTVSTKNFATLVSDAAAAVQGAASQLVDLTIGSILRAVIEATSAQGLWLQSQILSVLAVTRAATSTGSDLDSFVGDYGLTRDPAVGATTQETFSRFTDTSAALIPVGAQVQSADGTQTFAVIEDDTNPYWNAGSNGYNLNAGTHGIAVPIQATTPGAASNVIAGQISVLLTAIPYVDTVNNASQATGGADEETDAALRVRFQQFLQGLASATVGAIDEAINSVQAGLQYSVVENYDPNGNYDPGYLTIVVDNGTGSPGSTILNAVTAAVNLVRAAGIRFGVFGPTVTTANVSGSILTAPGYGHSAIATACEAAVTAYINALDIGATLRFTSLYSVIYGVSPGITDVSGLTLNSGTSDLTAASGYVIRAGTVVIT